MRCGATPGTAVVDWMGRHPYLAFLAFIALMFGLMALCGLDDYADRVRALGGM